MTTLKPGSLEIEPHELVRFLLEETGQTKRDAVNPADLLAFLGLKHVRFDFDVELPPEAKPAGRSPRALLSFPDRLVATHDGLHAKQRRFSVLHEIAHYVLPGHEYSLYLDDDECLSAWTRTAFEREANEFAADLLFQGDRFTLEANSHSISAATIKELGDKYRASYEAAGRRLVERNLRPVMLVVFKETDGGTSVDVDEPANWSVRYCITSPTFRNKYFRKVEGTVPSDITVTLSRPGRDVADSERVKIMVGDDDEEGTPFEAEFFTNSYNIFCLLTPLQE